MINKETRTFKKFVEQCADFCKTAGLKTKKQIYDWLAADLTETYKTLPQWKIESIAENLTQSVAYQMGIRR
jgi:hypothetical protein